MKYHDSLCTSLRQVMNHFVKIQPQALSDCETSPFHSALGCNFWIDPQAYFRKQAFLASEASMQSNHRVLRLLEVWTYRPSARCVSRPLCLIPSSRDICHIPTANRVQDKSCRLNAMTLCQTLTCVNQGEESWKALEKPWKGPVISNQSVPTYSDA